ncbi:hypothetical protein ACFOY8_14960 [Thalassospira xianhensis]|nr:hypothetical protein [Thalassospira xianhensis]
MLFPVEIYYQTALLRENGEAETVHVKEVVQLPVIEIDAEAFPYVACLKRDTSNLLDETLEIRKSGAEFYHQLTDQSADTSASIARILAAQAISVPNAAAVPLAELHAAGETFSLGDRASTLSSSIRALEDTRLLDGQLFIQCGEPGWEVITPDHLRTSFRKPNVSSPDHLREWVRPDQLEAYILGREVGGGTVCLDGDLSDLKAGAFSYRQKEWALRHQVWRMMSWFGDPRKPEIVDLSSDDFDAIQAIYKAVRKTTSIDEPISPLTDAIKCAAHALEKLPEERRMAINNALAAVMPRARTRNIDLIAKDWRP